MKKLYILMLVSTIISNCMYSQDIYLGNGFNSGETINTCGGKFFDSGGPNSNYGGDENYVVTLCPDNGGRIMLDFTGYTFDVSEGGGLFNDPEDQICIYDGDNTNERLFACYNNSYPLSSFIQASAINTSGCLTIEFTSGSSFLSSFSGWEADISCLLPCQDVLTDMTLSTTPNPTNNYHYVCKGDLVNFSGSGLYPENDTYYNQSDAQSDFRWIIDGENQTVINDQNFDYTFDEAGIYRVDLEIQDQNGCKNLNYNYQVFVVSETPNFSGTSVDSDEICLGETNTLRGFQMGSKIDYSCGNTPADTVFLPDGTGVSYESTIPIKCFEPDQEIVAQTDIVSVCLDLEHSYVGDLNFYLKCPNGQTVELSFNGNGANGAAILGNPVGQNVPVDDISNVTDPGTPLTYCFSPTSNNGLIYDDSNWELLPTYTDRLGNVSNSVPRVIEGVYEITGNWDDLNGCPLRGDWTIIVEDDLEFDNGYIFNWDIQFDNSLIPPSEKIEFTQTFTDSTWLNDPTIISQSDNEIIVQPTTTGQNCYTYQVTDTLGCIFDTTICFNVLEKTTPTLTTTDFCLNGTPTTPTYSPTGGSFSITPPATNGTYINSNGELYPTEAGQYNIKYISNENCSDSIVVPVTVLDTPSVTISGGDICIGDSIVIDAGNFNVVSWYNGTTSSSITYYDTETDIWVLVEDANGCRGRSNPVEVNVYPAPIVDIIVVDNITSVDLIADGASTYNWSPNSNLTCTDCPQTTSTAGTPTLYTVIGTDENGCVDTAQVTVSIDVGYEIPNIITPNGDGINDNWFIISETVKEANIKIYNRWGNLVFETSDWTEPWDGGKNSEGIYYYFVDLILLDDSEHSETGTVTLLKK